jgi:hypothetical protein
MRRSRERREVTGIPGGAWSMERHGVRSLQRQRLALPCWGARLDGRTKTDKGRACAFGCGLN